MLYVRLLSNKLLFDLKVSFRVRKKFLSKSFQAIAKEKLEIISRTSSVHCLESVLIIGFRTL